MLKWFKFGYFLGKNPWNIEINPYLCTVFFIVLDLRLTKVWVTAVTLFLCFTTSYSSFFQTENHILSSVSG